MEARRAVLAGLLLFYQRKLFLLASIVWFRVQPLREVFVSKASLKNLMSRDFTRSDKFTEIYGKGEDTIYREKVEGDVDVKFLIQWRETLDKLRESLRSVLHKAVCQKKNVRLFDKLEKMLSERALYYLTRDEVPVPLQKLICDRVEEALESFGAGQDVEELQKLWSRGQMDDCVHPHLAYVFHEIGLTRRSFDPNLDKNETAKVKRTHKKIHRKRCLKEDKSGT